MRTRILLNPTPTEGGGAETPTPAATPTATPAPVPAPAPTTQISVSQEDYKRFLDAEARLAEKDREAKRLADDAEQERLKSLAAKGQAEQALKEQREKYERDLDAEKGARLTIETERLNDKKEIAIREALAGVVYSSPTAAVDMRTILDARYEAVRDASGNVAVVEKATRRPAADAIKDYLASPESDHFKKPSTTGGAGSQGSTRPAPAPNPADDSENPYIKRHLAARAAAGSNGNLFHRN